MPINKQEEEAATQEPEEETMEACIKRMMEGNENLTEEAAREMCQKQKEPAAEAPAEEKAFMDKLMGVFEEAMEARMTKFWDEVNKRIETTIQKVEDQAVTALRKGLGIEHDPVVHLSELPGLMRKVLLEETKPGKRTETETKDKPTQGKDAETKVPSAEKTFDDLMKQRRGF